MRALIAALVSALTLAGTAAAITVTPLDQLTMDRAASWMANQRVTVKCMEPSEELSPGSQGAWAYVYLQEFVIYIDARVCKGIIGIIEHNPNSALWIRAFGALVLTHESFHLRLNMGNRGSEAATECRAIRHVAYMMARLGAPPELVERLMPYAVAEHYHLSANHPEYYKDDCVVPGRWG